MKLLGKELNPKIIKVTFILLFLCTLFPPFILSNVSGVLSEKNSVAYYRHSFGFLFDPPSNSMTTDVLTLLVEYVLVLLFMSIAHLFMKDKEKSKSE